MLQGRKGKGMCAVLLMLAMCFGPLPAAALAEDAPPDGARQYIVEYTVNGTRWPDWTFSVRAESGEQALAAAPDYLEELGGDYEKLPQEHGEGTVITVAYRTKICLASTLVVEAEYYDPSGMLAGAAEREYAAPAGERAVIDYLDGTFEEEEYIPVRLVFQATPFADSDSTEETRLSLTDSLHCREGVHYVLRVRFERSSDGQKGLVACENEALQTIVRKAALAQPQAAYPVQVAASDAFEARKSA